MTLIGCPRYNSLNNIDQTHLQKLPLGSYPPVVANQRLLDITQLNLFIFGLLFLNIQIKKTWQGNLLLLLVPSSKPLAASLPTVATTADPLCLRWAPQPFFDAHQTISPGHAHRVHHVYHPHFTHHAHNASFAHRSHGPI